MNTKTYHVNDIIETGINRQEVLRSAGSVAEAGVAFFICSVDGSSIVIKDADGVTITTVSNKSYYLPYLRIENGFSFTGTGAVTFFRMR